MEVKPDTNPETNRRLRMPRPAGFKLEKSGDTLKITTARWDGLRWFGPKPKVLTYYGCRICGQSQEFLPLNSSLIAVLDEQMTQKYVLQDETIYGNLLQQRQLFDFDAVHIRRASDEAVERFAIQVGNDTDPGRRPYYASMPCLIWSSCGLSENSIKILKRTFGQVEVKRVS